MHQYLFFKFPVTKQVFHFSKHSFALVNLKPLVPGHVLIVPKRQVSKLSDLPNEESIDFFEMVKFVENVIIKKYKADAMNLAIQDGLAAGQSVPHLHCHLIPRYLKDGFGDDIYKHLELWEGGLIQYMTNKGEFKKLVPDQPWFLQVCENMNIQNDFDRKERGIIEMEQEAFDINKYIKQGGFL